MVLSNGARQEHLNLSWKAFKEYDTLQIRPLLHENLLGELAKLSKNGLMEDYLCQFQELLAHGY
ncbi:hypothetical protein PVK06_010503 [Gossypium arboreum]|uniref:Uncharacterized protein n=1 Tax=Gossypium arboreum TaxID=29729 RepID=A0ABR0Q6H6_GOSAR|nr:hypothetical protein PVK06_010503 [Gossypium arboreum]